MGEWKGEEDRMRQNEKERRERGYLSVQAKLVLFDALTHKPERQENNNDKKYVCVCVCVLGGGGRKGESRRVF